MLHEKGIVRIQTDIRVGSRTDKVQTMQDKVSAVERLLAADHQYGAAAQGGDEGQGPSFIAERSSWGTEGRNEYVKIGLGMGGNGWPWWHRAALLYGGSRQKQCDMLADWGIYPFAKKTSKEKLYDQENERSGSAETEG
jgi:hypothetical protein